MQIKPWWIAVACCIGILTFFLLGGLLAGKTRNAADSDQKQSAQIGLEIGNLAPKFEFISLDGKTIRSADLRGLWTTRFDIIHKIYDYDFI